MYIGSYSDVQDSGSNSGRIKIDDDAVIAHGAELSGDVEIGIDIPAGKSVLPGSVIDSPDR